MKDIIKVIRYKKDIYGEVEEKAIYEIQCEYVKKESKFNTTSTSYNKPELTYSKLFSASYFDSAIPSELVKIEEGDKIEYNNKEYDVLYLNPVIYKNVNYVNKVEFGL